MGLDVAFDCVPVIEGLGGERERAKEEVELRERGDSKTNTPLARPGPSGLIWCSLPSICG